MAEAAQDEDSRQGREEEQESRRDTGLEVTSGHVSKVSKSKEPPRVAGAPPGPPLPDKFEDIERTRGLLKSA